MNKYTYVANLPTCGQSIKKPNTFPELVYSLPQHHDYDHLLEMHFRRHAGVSVPLKVYAVGMWHTSAMIGMLIRDCHFIVQLWK